MAKDKASTRKPRRRNARARDDGGTRRATEATPPVRASKRLSVQVSAAASAFLVNFRLRMDAIASIFVNYHEERRELVEKTEAADLIEQNVAELMQLCYRGASAGVGLNFPARRLARSLALAPPGAAHHRFGARERALPSPARRHARLDRGRARGGRAPRPLGVSTIPRARAPGAGAGSGARARARATARTRPSPPQARSGRTTRPRRTRAGRASTCRRAAPRRPPTASGPRPWSRHPSQVAARAARRVLPLGQPARRAASANAFPEPSTRARARRVASPPSSPRSRRTSQIADEGGPATHQLVAATVIPDRSAARRGARAIATEPPRADGRGFAPRSC